MGKKPYILWFDEIGLDDLPVVGGKNASLGEMRKELTKQGVNVPNGFAITVNAYHSLLDEGIVQDWHDVKGKTKIKEGIQEILSGLDVEDMENLSERGSRVRRLIHSLEFPREIVEEVVKGAKAHMTGGVNSHEILIMPTQAMREEDKDYALACAFPLDAPGVVLIFGRQTNEERKFEEGIDVGNPQYGLVGGEALIIFENVFVPWERVFLCGEYDMAGVLVERFATLHRQNYGGCKGGVSDVLVGATALAAEYQGTAGASHIKEKLAEMIHLAETIYSGSVACSAMGYKTPSGAYYPDPLLANTTKHNVTRHIYEIARLAHDIAGGIVATMPFQGDLESSEVGRYVKKYLAGAKGIPVVDRMKILRLIENMSGGTALVESMHGAGSPQTQKVMYGRLGNLEQKKRWAKRIVGIE